MLSPRLPVAGGGHRCDEGSILQASNPYAAPERLPPGDMLNTQIADRLATRKRTVKASGVLKALELGEPARVV